VKTVAAGGGRGGENGRVQAEKTHDAVALSADVAPPKTELHFGLLVQFPAPEEQEQEENGAVDAKRTSRNSNKKHLKRCASL
jgi:hypothetical protein